MSITSIQRDTNNNVSLVRIISTDTLEDISAANYILEQQENINTLNGGVWEWFTTDMLLVASANGNAFFEFIDADFTSLVIFGAIGSGIIEPGLTNQLPYYSSNGRILSPLASGNNSILATSNVGVPALTQVLPTAVQSNITTVGTVGTGTWNATPIGVPFGGTDNTTFTAYSVICAGTTATGAFQNVSGLGTSGFLLTSQGPGLLPVWAANAASGTVNPGTANDIAYYQSTGSAVSPLTSIASRVLVTSGLGVPNWSDTLPSGLTIPGYLTTTLTSTQFFVGNGSNIATAVNMSGDAALANTGAVTVSKIGGVSISLAGSFTTSGAFTVTQTYTGNTNVTFPTSGTLATTTSSLVTINANTGSATVSGGAITINGGTTGLTTTASGSTVSLTGTLILANGGTNASLTASNGGIVYSTASAFAILAGTATAGQILQSASSAAPAWSSATYPSTAGTQFNVLQSTGTNITSATLTSVIDGAIGSTQGNILYRNSTVWTVLAPGTSGQLLQTKGAAANPAYTTATYPDTAGTSGNILTSNGTNFVSSAPASGGFTIINVQQFTASGTYTPTANMKYCIIEAVGSGGGGSGLANSAATQALAASGGGGGSYSRKFASAATIGASQTVTIGTAGTGGASGNNAGTAGGDTSVGTICIGKGGGGAGAGSSGAGGAGGVAGTGDFSVVGEVGMIGVANSIATITPDRPEGGSSGLRFGCSGQRGAWFATENGAAGAGYGAGGNGGVSWNGGGAAAGGNGSAGIVIVTEYI